MFSSSTSRFVTTCFSSAINPEDGCQTLSYVCGRGSPCWKAACFTFGGLPAPAGAPAEGNPLTCTLRSRFSPQIQGQLATDWQHSVNPWCRSGCGGGGGVLVGRASAAIGQQRDTLTKAILQAIAADQTVCWLSYLLTFLPPRVLDAGCC